MRTAASKREEIQMKLELLRQEREREQRAFSELAEQNVSLTAAQVSEAAMRRAAEEEPNTLVVGDTVLSVGDYVDTIDDIHNLQTEERGIFVPDPVKQVYLGERGKITRVLPSFQGKSAVEMRFADGARKVFLTSCLALNDGKKKVAGKESSQGRAPRDSVSPVSETHQPSPTVPEPTPQPSWETIQELRSAAYVKNAKDLRVPSELRVSRKATVPKVISEIDPWKALAPAPPATVQSITKGTSPAASAGDARIKVTSRNNCRESQAVNGAARGSVAAGPVLVIQSDELKATKRPQSLGPTDRSAEHIPIRSKQSQEPTRPRTTSSANVFSTKSEPQVASLKSPVCRSIPTSCPANYQAKYSMSDKNTGIPLDSSEDYLRKAKNLTVSGMLPGRTLLQFQHIVLPADVKTFPAVLDALTHALNWKSSGQQVKRLFTPEGNEILRVEVITDGMSLVATSGHAYPGPPAAVETPTGAVGTGRTVMSASKPPETKAPVVRKQRQEGSGAGKSQPAQQPKARPVSPAAAPKGIAKPISVRVFENGEYGDQKTDRFPYRTITLRPTHKTMRAVMNTIDRELAWNSVGKKVDVIYDATGCEITSVDQLTNGQAIVASAGDRFVIPHPSSILHEEVVKLSMASSSAPNPVA